MAKAKFDIKTLELPAVAAKPLYAGVGATDLAVEYVREYVADVQKKFAEVQKDVQSRVAGVQKNVKGFEFEPKVLREQTVTTVNSRVSEFRSDARAQVEKVQTRVNENVATVSMLLARMVRTSSTAPVPSVNARSSGTQGASTTASSAVTTPATL